MNTRIELSGVWIVAVCALALGGCDSVKDVRSEPATALPKEQVVLKGVIMGLGGGRAITLAYDGNPDHDISLVGPEPAFPSDAPESVPFSFGALEEGTSYNVDVRAGGQPFGKHCEPVGGSSGTLVKGQDTQVVIECTPDIPRRDLTVQIPAEPAVFSGLPGAKIVLHTGEWMQERAVTPGLPSVTFDDALFSATIPLFLPNGQPQLNPDGSQAHGPAGTPLVYSVAASYTDADGNENRCFVTNFTGQNPIPSTANPSGNVTNVIVGLSTDTDVPACQFTMTGSVAYNSPPGGTPESGSIPGGLLLEVRDLAGNVRATHEVTQYGTFTVGGTTTPALFPSNVNSFYDVVVARQPTGRTCVVGDGGGVSFYRTGVTNPAHVTPTSASATVPSGSPAGRAWGSRLNVFCRVTPASENTLSGTYRLTSSTWKAATPSSGVSPAPITVAFNAYDWTVQNLGSSNMMTFFADGTFLYGTHAYISGSLPDLTNAAPYSTQVEHGFYDYNASARTLRFTLTTDSNPTSAYPTAYGAISNVVWNAARTGTPGLSAAPAPVVSGTATAGGGIGIWTAVMNNVQKSSVTFDRGRNASQVLSRITGTFGGATAAAARLDWELTEPQSMSGEMTGTWVSRDNRRFWVWDYLTYYGTHVGVAGGAPSMNDACFTTSQLEAPHGVYTRRGSSTGCFAYNRPARGDAYLFGIAESVDFHLTDSTLSTNTFVGVAPLPSVANSRLVPQFGTNALAVLPGFAGRIPGGQTAADGRSPSPVVYKIAPASSFGSEVATTFISEIGQPSSRYFDNLAEAGPFTDWCQTEILGLRPTLNGEPLNSPVYFCRSRAE